METTHPITNPQHTLWNGAAGQAWVDSQQLLDHVFQPFENLLVQSTASARRVLDVGCGTGAVTLAIARNLARNGACTGIDISNPMIETARARAARENSSATFLCADAQTYPFPPATFDTIVSRFGVMFFADPVQAFANLRHAASPHARLLFTAFRSPSENPFMTTAERAAAPLLPGIPARRPDAPGQFAFAARDRVQHILNDSGWAEIAIQPIDVACTLPESELTTYLTRLGPLGLVLANADEQTRRHVASTVRAAFEPYVHGPEVRFTAACWLVSAKSL